MLPYLLMLFFVLFWIFLEHKAINRRSFFMPLLAVSLFAGARGNRVGTDSWKYALDFTNEVPISNISINENIEPGYNALRLLILSNTHNYFWLFFITAFIISYCSLRTLKKYSDDYIFAVLFFITLGTYSFVFNGIRQGLAMGFFSLATPYILNRKILPYIIIVLFASLFHKSALVLLPFYFLAVLNIKDYQKVIISFSVSAISSSAILNYLASNNPRYELYTQEVENSGGYLILSFYVGLAAILYIFKYLYKINDQNFNRLLVFYTVGVVSIIPLAVLGTDPSGPQRLIYYFVWILSLLIPYPLKYLNNKFYYFLALVLSVTFFILTTTRFGNLTPYTLNPLLKVI